MLRHSRLCYNVNMNKPKAILLDIETSREPGRGFIEGISKYAHIHGGWQFCTQTALFNIKSKNDDPLNGLDQKKIAGVMTRNSKTAAKALKLNIPTIVLFQTRNFDPRLNYIIYDNKAIAAIAAEHFLNAEHKNFAYCGYKNMQWSIERGQNLNLIIKENGLKVHNFQYAEPTLSPAGQTEDKRLKEWLRKLPKPIAIFTCNDDMGLHLIEICKSAQFHIPQEIAVLGVDNDQINNVLADVPLSSISLNF